MHDLIREISDFIFVSDKPQQADVIMVAGGSHPQLPEKAAGLWHAGYAPRILLSGGVSIKKGFFPGPQSKTEIYNGQYATEYAFFRDVLLKNGVPQQVFFGEDRSAYTRQNADFSRMAADRAGLRFQKALLVCLNFHARRCLCFYQAAFPETDFFVIPVSGRKITKDNWFQSDYGIQRVLGELARCGQQLTADDMILFQTAVSQKT